MEKKPPQQAAAEPKALKASPSVGPLKLFSGNANRPLSEKIASYIGTTVGRAEVGRFADGEINVHIQENVRGKDCYVIQPTCRPANENLMELLIMIDALTRASAGRITAVIPYFGYARADRKSSPRVPITAKLVANLISKAGAERVITVDLHAGQIQGFFDIPLDHIFAMPVVLEYFRVKKLEDVVVVSPDVGGVERARAFAKRLKAGLAIVDKRRPRPNEASIYNVIGDVEGKIAIIVDDMVDTGGTLTKVANKIKDLGAKKVYASCVHGVLSGSAAELVEKSSLEELVLSDSVPLRGQSSGKITTLSIAPLLGEAILRNHQGESISELFV
ncbi:MAG: ribose-phosphate pyrophosphokinase [Elusimicrobia bacterium CG_4_9_14_3_um_filter_62_55]|nr:MAG: ribose-phosphate pyrophosphokinase [Elusimicrobia bacterium CG22_combo_CG10-13_8_21_14_all_63_91]PJA16102.1 MAG: ribose-phosphate pyrophosphokinase [Elusimicrobia bacterium CG_4_10_14_0_2_um_filter_63_34]PJB24689.1 MAG: ribose-phosphate pyrophosphokinase [Elusimicrobia bacterium CG_4_9_14_3_um_filter_62_55]